MLTSRSLCFYSANSIKSIATICCLLLFILLHLTSSTQLRLSSSSSSSLVGLNRTYLQINQMHSKMTTRVRRSPRHFEATKTSTSAGHTETKKHRSQPLADPGRQANPEALTFRDGTQVGPENNNSPLFSANNRGSMAQATSSQRAATQWIPIVKPVAHQPPQVAPSRPPTQPLQRPPASVNPNQRQQPRNRHHRPNRNGHQLNPQARPPPVQPLESLNHFRHMHHHQHLNHHHHHHRRPRLNFELAPGGMYRRVLLCDKTLVSLDYVRNLASEPRRPHLPPLPDFDLNELTDNFIDLDGNYDSSQDTPTIVSRNTTIAETNSTTSTDKLNASESYHLSSQAAASAAAIDRSSLSSFTGHPHALLSDDDPLVRCDMWDLEKGLKNRAPPEHLVRRAIKADFDTVREAINRCRQLSEKTHPAAGLGLAAGSLDDDSYRDHSLEIMSTEDLLSLFSMKRGLIPGTKWCGLGDQANSYNDLGPKYRIDICCRAHDHCPIRSKPFRNDYGVLNIGLYTKSHCDCDADFYRCLREVRSRTADLLGNLYFNVMKLQCMREERLKVCREMKPMALLGIERCIKYEDSPIKTVFKFTTPPVAY